MPKDQQLLQQLQLLNKNDKHFLLQPYSFDHFSYQKSLLLQQKQSSDPKTKQQDQRSNKPSKNAFFYFFVNTSSGALKGDYLLSYQSSLISFGNQLQHQTFTNLEQISVKFVNLRDEPVRQLAFQEVAALS